MARRYKKISRNVKPPRRSPLQGQYRYECTAHGFIVDAIGESTEAWCPCGRKGKRQ